MQEITIGISRSFCSVLSPRDDDTLAPSVRSRRQWADHRFDLIGRERLLNVPRCSGAQETRDDRWRALGRDDDDVCVAKRVVGFELLEKLEARHLRHVDAAQDEIDGRSAKEGECLDSVRRFENLVGVDAGFSKGTKDDLSHRCGIVDEKNVHAHPQFTIATRPGARRRKVPSVHGSSF
jgi:hypothetical protein